MLVRNPDTGEERDIEPKLVEESPTYGLPDGPWLPAAPLNQCRLMKESDLKQLLTEQVTE
jgi:hypothetical protein